MTIQNRDNILLCETTLDLQGITGYNTLLAFVRGVTAPNDGQQGTFYWNGTSTLPGDNVTGSGPVNVVDPFNGHGPPGRWLRDTTGAGSGSLTQLNPGTGITLTPNPITLTGSVALSAINSNTVMANLAGTAQPPSGVQLSAILDTISTAPGAILYRSPTAWLAVTPGANGTVLTISSALPNWVAGGIGTVTQVNTGQGLTGGPVTATGTVSLDIAPPNTVLGNASGSPQAAGAVSLTQLLDSAFSSTPGAILYREGTAWQALAPGIMGQVLTQGSGVPAWQAVTGTGTVTQVNTGTGLTGGPITTTGTVAFATAVARTVLANATASPAAPSATTPSALFDAVFSASTGAVIYRTAGSWAALSVGTSGQVLTTATSGVPVWASTGAGSVTAITIGSGLSTTFTSGIISSTGTVQLATQPDNTVLANTSGAVRVPLAVTPSALLDYSFGGTTGNVLYRTAGSWASLGIGSSGQALTVATSGTNVPVWSTLTGTGTVTSVALAVPPIFGVSGSPVTTTGTLGMSVVAQGSGVFWAGSSGSSVTTTPSFRQMVSSDFPVNPSFTGNASVSGQLSVTSAATVSNLTASGVLTVSSSASVAGYMSFGKGLNINITTITSAASSYTINPHNDYLIVVNQSSAVAISINLPSSPTKGDIYAIKDGAGVAATYNITVVATSGTVDGNSSLSLTTNFGSFGIAAIKNGGPWAII